METLPPELIEFIAQHLTIGELAACRATSHTWRDIFSDDHVWKSRCNREIVEHLKTLECCVKPGFVFPECEDSSLSPLGEWQLHYLREQHLWNNWRQARWKMEGLTVNCPIKKAETVRRECFLCKFVTNNYLITSFKKTVLLWDVRRSPQYVSEPFHLLSVDRVCLCETIGNDRLVVVQNNSVLVLNFGSPVRTVWTVEHVFFFDQAETIPFSQVETLASSYDFNSSYFSSIIIGMLFVGVLRSGEMHVWNLDSGKKLGRFDCRCHEYGELCNIVTDNRQSNDFVVMMCKNFKYSFLIFSLSSLAFLPFNITLKLQYYPNCALLDKFIALRFSDSFRVYDYHTSQLVLVIPVDYANGVLTVNNYFVFITIDTIHLFNVASGKYNSVFLPLTDGFEEIDSISQIIMCGRFLETSHAGGGLIWEIKAEPMSCSVQLTQLRSFYDVTFHVINKACTKQAISCWDTSVDIANMW